MSHSQRLSEEQFVAYLRSRLPNPHSRLGSATELWPATRSKVDAAALRHSLQEVLGDPPSELIESLRTVGEAYEWYVAREPDLGSVPQENTRVVLRPVTEGDVPEIYLASASYDRGFRWRYRGTTPSMADFLQQLFDGVHAQFMVTDPETGQTFGLVCSYNARFESRSVYIGFVRTSPHGSGGEVLHGILLLVEYLFRHWDFKKVYAEVPEFNVEGMFDLNSKAIRIEGRLVEHWFYDGRWWDQLVIALWREDWYADGSLRPVVLLE